jgi:hypothetical protein
LQRSKRIATAHFVRDRVLKISDRIIIAGRPGIWHSIIPVRGQNEQRLIIQLVAANDVD